MRRWRRGASRGGPAALLVAMAIALFARIRCELHRQMPARFPLSRLRPSIWLALRHWRFALVSPLEALDDRLLITHMVQHLLLLMIAPPLLLLGAPQIPLVRAIPPVDRETHDRRDREITRLPPLCSIPLRIRPRR